MDTERTGCRSTDDQLAGSAPPAARRRWYAVFTVPQNEKAVVKQLNLREIQTFLPTYEVTRLWKNRQRVKTILPLFPTYLFVRINSPERLKVIQSPGVLQIVGNGRESVPLADDEVDVLLRALDGAKAEPYREFVVGEKVRIKSGLMEGIQGTLVRKNNRYQFVMTLGLINQHAAIHVDPDVLEPAPA